MLETGRAGRVTVTAKLKRRTLATARANVKASGRVTLRLKLPRRRGTATVKATFRPTSGGAAQTVSARVTLRRG